MTTYKDSGVDIDAANNALKKIKKHATKTYNKFTLSDIGSFGGCYELPLNKYQNPVLVSSVDGVGTKLLLATLSKKYDTIGQCLVNHCVNDILVIGAKPLFFLDYFATGKLNPAILEKVVKGFSDACKENSCVLIGGETAEMPGFYDQDKFDVSGTIIGIVEKENIMSSRKAKAGDLLIGLPSNGLHTNGYSLARNVLLSKYEPKEKVKVLNKTIYEELLKVHRSYLPVIDNILDKKWLKAMAHITGGGIIENTLRVIDEDLDISIDWKSWEWQPIFKLIMEDGSVPIEDMIRTFNLGIGMILIIDKNNYDELSSHLNSINEKHTIIGSVIKK